MKICASEKQNLTVEKIFFSISTEQMRRHTPFVIFNIRKIQRDSREGLRKIHYVSPREGFLHFFPFSTFF